MLSFEDLPELVTLVGRGDEQAFARLFHHFAPRVAAYLAKGGSSAAVAEDLAQETMVLLWRKAASFDSRRGTVTTWVFTIARHLRIDQHRKRGGVVTQSISLVNDYGDPCEDELVDQQPLPEERLGVLQRERLVRKALTQLTPQQAKVVCLSFFAESSQSDIAKDLELPLGTVKSQIRRALQQMRRFLESPQP